MTEGGDFCFTVHLCPHAAALLKDPPNHPASASPYSSPHVVSLQKWNSTPRNL